VKLDNNEQLCVELRTVVHVIGVAL
jgi:hypothetical protein